jgi:hypothetical protein
MGDEEGTSEQPAITMEQSSMNRKDFHTKIVIRVFYAGKSTTRILRPKPGHHWNDAGIDELLDWVGAELEKRYPGEDFRMTPVGIGGYNFIHTGKREIDLGAGTLEVDGVPVGRVDSAKITLEGGS